MKILKYKDIIALTPCPEYNENLIRDIIGDGKTTLQVLQMQNIPAQDRMWLVHRDASIIESTTAILYNILLRALTNNILHKCNEPKIVEWASNWINGNDRSVKMTQFFRIHYDYNKAVTASIEAVLVGSSELCPYGFKHACINAADAAYYAAVDTHGVSSKRLGRGSKIAINAMDTEYELQVQDAINELSKLDTCST